RSDRHENRAEARSDRHENRAEARGDRHENRADGAGRQENRTVVRADGSARSAAPAPASPSTNRGAAGGAAPGTSDFRLNLSGAPGPIHTYPLANPNGIVIDVPELRHPGDATKLTSDDPRIRFVKILNRDTGVRFIVYVNGPLANYEVQPSGRGLRVAIAAAN
ncbi:MAG: AMIN domain-containing protein, partial [Deltaproteobacteria bacterium]|nr:AMIN domain-containing protein [Deltaproteobacteria bacterium]